MRFYEATLRTTLEHPLILAVFAIALVAGSYLCYSHTGSDLLPEIARRGGSGRGRVVRRREAGRKRALRPMGNQRGG